MTHDTAVVFPCGAESLVGIVSHPDVPGTRGVVVIVGGPQYRVGSHRQFVQLAHRLAAAGHPVLRFDYRGMGDSTGSPQPFDEVDDDIAAAIDALAQACPEVRDVVLWGLCDAASAAAIYVRRADPRVRGIALVNPWVRHEATHAAVQVRHYYRGRLLSRAWWRKLVRGGVDLRTTSREVVTALLRMVRGGGAGREREDFRARMAAGAAAFGGPLLLLISGRDITAREFEAHAPQDERWRGVLSHARTCRRDFADADHTFSRAAARRAMEDATIAWLRTW
jgi:exosortase A-associated hydrolase 1